MSVRVDCIVIKIEPISFVIAPEAFKLVLVKLSSDLQRLTAN